MGNVVVDKNKCIGCGMCQKDCVSSDIEMKENTQKEKYNEYNEKLIFKVN